MSCVHCGIFSPFFGELPSQISTPPGMKPSFEWERSTGFGLAALRRMRRNSLHEATVAVTRRD